MKTNLTKNDVTEELKECVVNYLAARVFAEVTREAVDRVQAAILADDIVLMSDEARFHARHRSPGRILDPSQTWLGSDKQMPEYYRLCDEKLRAAGLKPDAMKFDFCPGLVAERNRTRAIWALFDEAAIMLDFEGGGKELNNRLLCLGMEKRQEMTDCLVGLVLSLEN